MTQTGSALPPPSRARRVLEPLALVALVGGFWLAMVAPPDAIQGDFYRILYIHVPSAWLAFLAFGVTALGSIGYLIRRRRAWDRVAAASASVGVVFTALTLVTGSIWGRPVWGVWWDFGDARLMSTAIMFFVYLGYLALRRTVSDPETRARRSAVLGAVAVIQVPLVYFSVNLFRTLHQTQTIRPDGAAMEPEMLMALLVNRARIHRPLRRTARPPHRSGPAGGDRRRSGPDRACGTLGAATPSRGGWRWVTAGSVFAYTVTYGMIAGYAVWLIARYRGLQQRLRQRPGGGLQSSPE